MNTNFPIHRNNFEQIRDERRTAANTAFRIGNAFLSLLGLIEGSNSDIEEQFLHSQVEDVAEEKITFRKGLQVGNRFTSGLLGEGGIFRKEADGTTYLEADKLYIRIKAFFDNVEIRDFKHSAGNRIASPAGMKCCRVEWLDANGDVVQQADANLPQVVRFRCYFRGSDGEDEVRNNFIVGDQAYCHITSVDTKADDPNSKGLNMKHYWRLVVGRNPSGSLTDDGEHWIDLSNQATETLTIDGHTYTHAGYQDGSDIPVAQDDIIQLGNIYDTDRMGAIIEFVTGADAPSYQIFQDINGFDLSGKNYLSLGYSTQTGHAYLNVYGDAYIGDPEGSTYIRYEQGDGTPQHRPSLRIKAHVEFLNSDQELDDLVQNHQRDDSYDDRAIRAMIAGLQDQIDGAIDTWFFNGTPGASVLPESDWKSKDEQSTPISYNERLKHLGDLYYDNQTGYAYRYVNSGSEQSPVFSWSPISDSAVVEALAAAARAQDTADHKRRIFLSTPYPPYDAGDMWVNAVWPASGTSQGSVYNDDILKCINPVPRTGVSAFSIDDWTKASKYTDDSKFNGYINALLNGSGASGDSATAAAVQRAIISAMGGSTVVSGGLMLTSMLALRKLNAGGDPTDLNDYTTWAGINGVYDDTKTTGGIAAWYGGGMKDYETLSAAQKANGWNTERWAKSLFRFDGSGYVAGGNISWDSAGAVTIQGTTINATNLQKGGSSVLSQAEGDARYITVSFFETLFNAMNSSGQKVSANTTTGIASIKAMFGFWTQQYISALGQNSEGGGGGQGDVTWALLASTATGGRTINISYLSNALSTLTGYSTSGGNYAVQKDANNHLYVNIPNVGTATNLAGGAAGSIPYQTAAGTTAFLAAGTSGQVLKINSSGLPYWTSDANTKNTAGTTNKVNEKMFLVGTTTQAANPVTYSNVNVYIGTDNKLYSNGKVVLVTDDIYDWAKAASKPSYDFSEIDNTPTTLSGYGITDAKIASGVITLGSNTITPVTSVAMSVPTGFSVSGSPVTKTGTLALTYASGYEGFTTTLKNRINTLWAMFTREGSGTAADPYVIKANYGLYTDSFLSALGQSSDGGGGGQGDVTWALLASTATGGRTIDISYITNALTNGGYATQSWVQQQGYTTNIGTVTQVKVGSTAYNPSSGVVSLPAYPTTLPASDVYAWAKAANKPTYTLDEVTDGSSRVLIPYNIIGDYTTNSTNYTIFASVSSTSTSRYKDCIVLLSGGGYYHTTTGLTGQWLIEMRSGNEGTPIMKIICLIPPNTSKTVSFGYYTDTEAGITYFGVKSTGRRGEIGITTILNNANLFTVYNTTTRLLFTEEPSGWTEVTYNTASLDVPSWAMASSKPTYTYSEVGAASASSVTTLQGYFDSSGAANSAVKLKTARTIWGQSFDGTANVSGAITGATTISASSNVSVGGTLGVTGATTLSGTLGVTGATTLTGLLTANGGITIPSGKTLTIGDAVLSWDATNQGIKITKGLYSQTFISALGAGSDSGGGGGQGDVTWTLLADNNDTRQIALSHLTTALSGYATQSWVQNQGYITSYTDTKNTAGSTNTSSKIFIIGATSQAANPQTYSHDTAYVGTDGCLYSGGTKVLTAHQSLSNYVTLNSAQTISATKTFSAQQAFTVAQGTAPFTVASNTLVTNLNADLLDGQQGTYYAKASDVTTLQGYFTNGSAKKAIADVNGRRLDTYKEYIISETDGAYHWYTICNYTNSYNCKTAVFQVSLRRSSATFIVNFFNRNTPYVTCLGLTSSPAPSAGGFSGGVRFIGSGYNAAIQCEFMGATGEGGNNYIGINVISAVPEQWTLPETLTPDTTTYESSSILADIDFVSGGMTTRNIVPFVDNNYDIGSSTLRYNGIYAATFYGALSGNAITATTLQTARTIWGQSFDGSANISGAITGATTISASSNVSVGGTLGVTGNTTLSSTLSVSGNTTISGTLSLKSNAYSGNYCLNCNNSDIIGVNSIYTADTSDDWSEGINFKRSDGNWDTLTGNGEGDFTIYKNNGSAWAGLNCGMIWVYGPTNATMTTATTNPRVVFAERVNGTNSQRVGIVYTDYNSYRNGKGLKVMDVDGDDPNVWFEVAGNFISTGAVTALSDIRHKNIIKDVDVSVEQIAQMSAVVYQWNDRKDKDMHVGSIAQDWQRILPEVVMRDGNKEGTLSMQYGVAALVSTIITARKVVDHEKRIQELEKENKRLKEMLNVA